MTAQEQGLPRLNLNVARHSMSDGGRQPVFQLDPSFGGIRGGNSVEISSAVADYFNSSARKATALESFTEFVPGDYVSIALPTRPLARADFRAGYRDLVAVLDESLKFRLCDYPHFYSSHPDNDEIFRGVPTHIPKAEFPDGFFGREHSIELRAGGVTMLDPVPKFFHDAQSGSLYQRLLDGEGKLTVEVAGQLGVTGGPITAAGFIVIDTDPAFGVPTGAVQRLPDGSRVPLQYQFVGLDYFGGELVFNNGVVRGAQPAGERLVIDILLPRVGSGFAVARGAGHTLGAACRADATVS